MADRLLNGLIPRPNSDTVASDEMSRKEDR